MKITLLAAAASAAPFAGLAAEDAAVDAADGTRGDAGVVLANAAAVIEEFVVDGEYRPRVVESAMKTPTPQIDVPQSLTVVSLEQLEDQALIDIADILRYTPGASIGQGEGHRDQITIRGQNTTADFFIDGLRDDVQYFRPLYNLERVEILRGANALVFGRGGGGGVINRVTKTPSTEESFAAGSASVDTFGSALVSGDLNVSAGDASAFRLNAYYESLNNHRDEFGGDRFAVNPTFAVAPGAQTRIVLSYEYVDDERVVDRGVPSLNGAPLEGFDNTFFGSPDANETAFAAHIARTRIDHALTSALEFNATAQYADYDKFYQNLFPVGFDAAANTVSLDGYRDETERQNFIIQSNLVGEFSTGFLGHTLLAGVEYGKQLTENARRDVVFADTNDDQISFAFSDPLAIPAFDFPVFTRNRESDAQFLSFYLQDQIDIGRRLKLVAGVRYDRFEIDVLDRIEFNDGANDGNDGFLDRTDEELSPRVGLIYKPRDNVSFYASYARSFLPRSGDQFLTLSPTTENLEPEKFDNYEVGLKWDLAADLSLTAALFRLDRENGVTVDPSDPDSNITIGSRTEGVELQLTGAILPQWRVTAGYSYLDGNERGRIVDGALANRALAQVPAHMFSIWNRYDVTSSLGLGLGVAHQSSQFASVSNAVALPGFTRVDAAVFYALTSDLTLQLNLENLLDADYFPAAHNDNNISTGEPVNARLTLRGRF